jgi:transcriptional regulator with XRE-family HTH domain
MSDDGEKDPIDIHVGRRLKQRRQALRLSQTQVAEKIGISYQQLQKYECGINRMGASRLFRLAVALRVSPGWLFEGAGEFQLDEIDTDDPPKRWIALWHKISGLPPELREQYIAFGHDIARRVSKARTIEKE